MAIPALSPGLKTFSSKLTAWAGTIFGEPTNADQAEALIFLLFVIGIGISVAIVAGAYFCFWLADLKKKRTVEKAPPRRAAAPAEGRIL